MQSTKLDNLKGGLEDILSVGGQHRKVSRKTRVSDRSLKSRKSRTPRSKKEITLRGRASEILQNPNEESREVPSEEGLLTLPDFNDALEKNCMKPQDIRKTLGEHETLHDRETDSDNRKADRAALLQDLQGDDAARDEKAFQSKTDKTKPSTYVSLFDFSKHLLDSWEKNVWSRSALASDATHSEERELSVCSLSCVEHAADWPVKKTCADDPTSEEGPQEETLTFPRKDTGEEILEKASITSKQDFLCCSESREEKRHRRRCKTETNSASAGVSGPTLSRSIKTDVSIKPCYVVLEDIGCKIRSKGKSSSMPPEVRMRSARQPKGNGDTLKKLHAILKDIMEKSCAQKPRKTPWIKKAEMSLAEENIRKKKILLEQKSDESQSSGTAGSGGEDSHHEKKGRETGSVDMVDMLCNQGLFTRLSLANSHDDHPAEPGRIHLLSTSPGKTREVERNNSAGSSATFSSGAHVSKMSVGGIRVSASSSEANCGDACQAHSRFEPDLVSPFSGGDCKNRFRGGTPVRVPTEGTVGPDPSLLDEKEFKEQGGRAPVLGERELDDCWFLMEISEVVEEEVPANDTEEEHTLRGLEHGEVPFDCRPRFPQAESKSTYQPLSENMTVLKPSKNGKGRRPSGHHETRDREINTGAEENSIRQPAQEKSPSKEEESQQSHLSHGVQRVFYELSGSTVKLLGIPIYDLGAVRLRRIPQLEDTSLHISTPCLENQDTCVSLSSDSTEEGKPSSTTERLRLDVRKTEAKKRTQGPCTSAAPIPGSLAYQEQIRGMVVDALRETLQKRLDASPELCVPKNAVSRLAKQVEREIFRLFCCVGQHYKKKYRSLLFNLKSTENQQLFRRVMLGEITPRRLVQMTSLEMAPQELAEWRARENRRVLEIIEKEEREAPSRCSAKFTHKGIVEIHREAEEDLPSQEILELQLHMKENSSSEVPTAPARDSGQKTGDSERRFKPAAYKATLNQKEKPRKHWRSSIMYSEEEGTPLQQDSLISSGIPKKNRRVEMQSKTTAVWKGLIQMFSIKQFMAKAYPVSGSSSQLGQALPGLLWSRGCIMPEDVWTYLDSIWPANSKEMGVIRFHPTFSRDFSYYHMLYTYLNNKQQYGIVNSHQMEIFMVPLAAYQPVPSQLRPLSGPGLDPSHPSLLLGLILPRKTSTRTVETRGSSPPKAKAGVVSLKNRTQNSCSPPASCSQADPNHTQPPLSGDEVQGEIPREESFTINTLISLTEELGRKMCQADPSWLHYEGPSDVAGWGSAGNLFLPPSGPPWLGEPLGSLPPGAQPDQGGGEQVQLCLQPDPSLPWDAQGHLLPSVIAWPEQQRAEEGQGVALWEIPFSHGVGCVEAGPPGDLSSVLPLPEILCPSGTAGEPSSVLQETLSLIEQVAQLQAGIQSQEPQLPSTPFGFPTVPQDVASAWPQAAAGLEFPPAQQDPEMYAHLQLLVSALSGPPPPPPAL
uniref:SPOC domain-containing protein 1 n=1 Tax=Pogona vitticeps TaxID=103695 RepID=A0ABM5ERV5_9SAUR